MKGGDELIKKEKLRVISEILSLYFQATLPDVKDKYWYGTVFDNLYDKDLTELYVTHAVYKKTKNKKHF